MKKEIIGDCTLYLGDCLEVMQGLSVVNHVITDPPYEKEAHTMGRRTNGKKSNEDGKYHREIKFAPLSFAAITEEIRDSAAQAITNLSDGWALTFCQAEAVGDWRDSYESAGAKFKRSMVWIKPDGMPQFNGQMPAMGYESITAAWCGTGHSVWNGGGRHGVFIFPKGEGLGPNLHETQKPVSLMRELVSLFSNPNETILDPFMGSGTTGVACAKLGRKFIGIELEYKYFDIACRRIEEAYKQTDLFIPAPIKHTQEKLI